MSETPIQAAVRLIGGQAATARKLEVSAGLVWQWLQPPGSESYRPVAERHCPKLENLSGIRCEKLRDDLTWTRDNAGQVTGYHVPLAAA